MDSRSRKRKALLTLGVIGLVAGLMTFGVFAAFTATTANSGNEIQSGTVDIDQHAGAATLYNVANRAPGDSTTACVRVTYSGSLSAAVKLYVSSGITNGDDYSLQIERGSGLTGPAADMNCTGFTATSTAFSGDLGTLGTSYAAGVDGKAAAVAWNQSDAVDYRFTISQKDDPTPNAHTSPTTSGAHTFTWEARSN